MELAPLIYRLVCVLLTNFLFAQICFQIYVGIEQLEFRRVLFRSFKNMEHPDKGGAEGRYISLSRRFL